MKRATRMLMMRDSDRRERPWEPEDRFRDRRGRDHYDNGRFAPMRSRYDGGDREPRDDGIAVWNNLPGHRREPRREAAPESYWPPFVPPIYEDGGWEEPTMNRIGFALEEPHRTAMEMNTGYHTDASYHRMNEMEHRTSPKMAGRSGGASHFTPEMAEEWMAGIKNQDGSKGPHWKMEDVKKLLSQRKLHKDPYEFWAVLNAIYSDYGHIAKKHGVNTMDFYVDMACAWLDDEDANPNKAAIYYEEIVK